MAAEDVSGGVSEVHKKVREPDAKKLKEKDTKVETVVTLIKHVIDVYIEHNSGNHAEVSASPEKVVDVLVIVFNLAPNGEHSHNVGPTVSVSKDHERVKNTPEKRSVLEHH